MFCAGDDVGHSQGGNNNAYCQDNEIGWINWTSAPGVEDLGPFIHDLVTLRREQPALRRSAFHDRDDPERGVGEGLSWFHPSGREMSIEDWENHDHRAMTIRIDSRHRDASEGDDLLVVLNGAVEAAEITLPGALDAEEARWQLRCTTADGDAAQSDTINAGDSITLIDRSLSVYVRGHS
jgi:glycogen operon protein